LHGVQIHEETVNAILPLRAGLLIQSARANSEAVGTIQNNFGTNGFGCFVQVPGFREKIPNLEPLIHVPALWPHHASGAAAPTLVASFPGSTVMIFAMTASPTTRAHDQVVCPRLKGEKRLEGVGLVHAKVFLHGKPPSTTADH
jgi:hypothetical protein